MSWRVTFKSFLEHNFQLFLYSATHRILFVLLPPSPCKCHLLQSRLFPVANQPQWHSAFPSPAPYNGVSQSTPVCSGISSGLQITGVSVAWPSWICCHCSKDTTSSHRGTGSLQTATSHSKHWCRHLQYAPLWCQPAAMPWISLDYLLLLSQGWIQRFYVLLTDEH